MQLTFGDAEALGQRTPTRGSRFLAEMDQVVPWKSLLALIEPHYPKRGRPGRQPYPLATMLRIHFLQQWYALSDPGMEEALYDRHSGDAPLRPAGVDATIIAAPSSTNNRDGERDPEMCQTRKGNQWHFGMRAHIGVDDESGLVHSVEYTGANASDVTQVHKLLHGQEVTVCGGGGYTGVDQRAELRAVKAVFWIAEKLARVRALKNRQDRRDAERSEPFKASLRAKIEHAFRVLKRQFGYAKVRYRGMAKNTAQTLRGCKIFCATGFQ